MFLYQCFGSSPCSSVLQDSHSIFAFPFFSLNLGLSGCVEANVDDFPIYAPRWTCGIRVSGKALCEGVDEEGSDATASASSSGSGSDEIEDTGTISVASSDERGGAASASSSSSSSPSMFPGGGSAQASTGESEVIRDRVWPSTPLRNPYPVPFRCCL